MREVADQAPDIFAPSFIIWHAVRDFRIESPPYRMIQFFLEVGRRDEDAIAFKFVQALQQRINDARHFLYFVGIVPGSGDGVEFIEEQDASAPSSR